jgi:hypothetical protein
VDSAAVLERLRALVGDELAAGWVLADFVRVEGSTVSWLATLEHPSDNIYRTVKERIAWTADPEFRLFRDKPTTPAIEIELPEEFSDGGLNDGLDEALDRAAPSQSLDPLERLEPLMLPVPPDIPAILMKPEAEQRRNAALLGILAGIVLALVLGLLLPPGNPIRQAFDPRTPATAAAAAILCLFFWGLFMGMNRLRRLKALDEMNDPDLLAAVINGLRSHGLAGVHEALRDEVGLYSPLLRRVRVSLGQWILRPGLQNARLVLEEQAARDRDETARGYAPMRIFVRAALALGCIGAVIGIVLAAAGFAHSLASSLDAVSRMKDGLVGLAGALSFAFLTSLEGLLAALILMLLTSALRGREERLFAGVDQTIAEEFLPQLQRAAPEEAPQTADIWTGLITEATNKVMEVIDAAGQSLLTDWEDKHQNYLADLDAVQHAVDRSTLNVVKALENGTSAIGFQLAQNVATQKNLFEQMLREAAQALQSQGIELNGATQNVIDALRQTTAEMGAEINSAVKSVTESLSQSSGEMGNGIKAVVEALAQSAEEHRNLTQKAIGDSSDALAAFPAELLRATGALTDLGKVTEQVLQSQGVLQDAMNRLGDDRLANLLSELDSTLKELKPALANLAQPFVLQAVPVRNNQA